MNKQECKEYSRKISKSSKMRMLIDRQIDLYFDMIQHDYWDKTDYKVGDIVNLKINTLIHGTRIEVSKLGKIRENGLIAPEFLGKGSLNKKKPYVVEFWKVDENITLGNFISKYCGVTIEVRNKDGEISQRIISPINSIEDNLLKLNDYRDYIIYQNQEQRFLPNKFNKNSTMAFIINWNEEKEHLLKNDIFSNTFDETVLKQILPEWFYEKYFITREFDNNETGRERAIIFGVPANFINGILVNKEIENNREQLELIKEIFPNCYICNIHGKIIVA